MTKKPKNSKATSLGEGYRGCNFMFSEPKLTQLWLDLTWLDNVELQTDKITFVSKTSSIDSAVSTQCTSGTISTLVWLKLVFCGRLLVAMRIYQQSVATRPTLCNLLRRGSECLSRRPPENLRWSRLVGWSSPIILMTELWDSEYNVMACVYYGKSIDS